MVLRKLLNTIFNPKIRKRRSGEILNQRNRNNDNYSYLSKIGA